MPPCQCSIFASTPTTRPRCNAHAKSPSSSPIGGWAPTSRTPAVGASRQLPRYRAAMARLIAGVDDDLRPLTVRGAYPPVAVPAGGLVGGLPITYPPDTIPAGGLEGGFVFVAGERNVPAYRPFTRAEDAAPLAAGGPPPWPPRPPPRPCPGGGRGRASEASN
jgi:hypothetical protein